MPISQMTRRTALKTLADVGLGCLVVSVSARALGLPAAAQMPPKIVIGTLPINAMLTSYVGPVDFFKEEGLSVELARSQAGPAINQAMAAGSMVVGENGLAPAMVALSRGLPIICPYLGAFGTPSRPFERIMVKDSSSIRKLEDLKGKKLALLGRGTIPELMLGALHKKANIRKEDIELVLIPPPNQPAALDQGLVDAIFATPPSDIVAEQQFKARTLANATDLVPFLGFTTVSVRRDFADAYPAATIKLFKACIRFARWIRDNETLARKAAGENLGLPDDLASRMRIPFFARNGLPVMPNVWHVYEMMVEAKTIEPHPDPAKLFNDAIVEPAKKFVLPAVEELGWQPDDQIEAMLKGEYPLLSRPPSSYYADWERRIVKT
jgi:NitT/TauT family transport system substrate-binding protein